MESTGGNDFPSKEGSHIDTKELETKSPHIAFAGMGGNIGSSLLRYGGDAEFTALYRKPVEQAGQIRDRVTDFDITNHDVVAKRVEELAKNGVRTLINGAGDVYTDPVEEQRRQPNRRDLPAYQTNVLGAANLADACRDNGVKLLHLSSKVVIPYDTENGFPEQLIPDSYLDIDETDSDKAPTWYGLTKALGEREVVQRYPDGSTIVRLEMIHGPNGGLFARTVKDLHEGEPFTRVNDMYSGHLTDKTVADALLTIEAGMNDKNRQLHPIYHLGASTIATPYDVAQQFAQQLGKPADMIQPISQAEFIASMSGNALPVTPRPGHAYLNNKQYQSDFGPLPSVEQEVKSYLQMYGAQLGAVD